MHQVVEEHGMFFLTTGTADKPCLHNPCTMLQIDRQHRTLQLPFFDAREGGVKAIPGAWPVAEAATFAPKDEMRQCGPSEYGWIDLNTAAIHGDQLWARAGDCRVLILQRGQKLDDAKKIENNFLDDGPVLQFFDTPYGLLAVGQGNVGIVELVDDK